MSSIAAVLTAIAELVRAWKEFVLRAWKQDGDKIAADLKNSKTDEEASDALKKLDEHMRGPK